MRINLKNLEMITRRAGITAPSTGNVICRRTSLTLIILFKKYGDSKCEYHQQDNNKNQ